MKNSANNDYNDEIKSYFKSIKDFKPLTKEQEKELLAYGTQRLLEIEGLKICRELSIPG